MDIIDGMILFFNIYVILVTLGILSLIFIYPLYYLLVGHKPGFIIDAFRQIFIFFTSNLPDWTKIIFFIITIFFSIMYVIYLIIIIVIPPTGFATLFIPLRELLLAIPPIPQLKNKGVFNVFDRFFTIIGNSNKELFGNKYINYLSFFKDNFYNVIKLFNPHLNIDRFAYLIENMQNNNKESEKRNIDNNIDMCIANNASITTPDMNFIELATNNISDIKNTVKCNLNALPAYISTSE